MVQIPENNTEPWSVTALSYFVNNVCVTDWQNPELVSKVDPLSVT